MIQTLLDVCIYIIGICTGIFIMGEYMKRK